MELASYPETLMAHSVVRQVVRGLVRCLYGANFVKGVPQGSYPFSRRTSELASWRGANGGRAAAKKRGVKFGPKPKLAAHQAREVARMVREEGKSLREVAHPYHVGHSTIVRALGRAEA